MKSAHPEFMSKRCSRISPPWKWMYPQVSLLLTSRGWAWGGGGGMVPVPKQPVGSWPNLIPNLWRSPAKTMVISKKVMMNWRIMKGLVYIEKKHSSAGIGLIALQSYAIISFSFPAWSLVVQVQDGLSICHMSIINQPSMHCFIKNYAYRRLPRINTVMGPGRRRWAFHSRS